MFLILLLCTLTGFAVALSPDRLDQVKQKISPDVLQELTDFNARQIEEIKDSFHKELDFTRRRIEWLRQEIYSETQDTKLLRKTVQELEVKAAIKKENGDTYAYSGFACVGEEISLSCTDERRILVTSAYYGQFISCADSTCCVPHPINDCLESIEDTVPQDWLALQLNCTNETSCAFVVPSGSVFSCVDPYYLDYMIVYYSCLPEPAVDNVGFTVYATSPTTYTSGDVIVFDSVQTNIGGYYQTGTNSFICPVSGTYVFSLSIAGGQDDQNTDIVLEGDSLLTSRTHVTNVDQGMTLVITRCLVDERVWVQCFLDGNMQGSQLAKFTSFSGFLLSSS